MIITIQNFVLYGISCRQSQTFPFGPFGSLSILREKKWIDSYLVWLCWYRHNSIFSHLFEIPWMIGPISIHIFEWGYQYSMYSIVSKLKDLLKYVRMSDQFSRARRQTFNILLLEMKVQNSLIYHFGWPLFPHE